MTPSIVLVPGRYYRVQLEDGPRAWLCVRPAEGIDGWVVADHHGHADPYTASEIARWEGLEELAEGEDPVCYWCGDSGTVETDAPDHQTGHTTRTERCPCDRVL